MRPTPLLQFYQNHAPILPQGMIRIYFGLLIFVVHVRRYFNVRKITQKINFKCQLEISTLKAATPGEP